MPEKSQETKQQIVIAAPRFGYMKFTIEGTAPYVQHKFSEKVQQEIERRQRAGSTARTKKSRAKRDFEQDYKAAMHMSADGWHGIPAAAFRNAGISACRVAGFTMTRAKLAIFIEPDGFDAQSSDPLVKITKGKPRMHMGHARNSTGVVDLRARPMWEPGWKAEPVFKFDLDQFTPTDIANLVRRIGEQVGIGEGRPDSRSSAGIGWGLFRIVASDEKGEAA